jgi:hypothetical protein
MMDVGEVWDQTEPVEFTVNIKSERHYFPIEKELSQRLTRAAEAQGAPDPSRAAPRAPCGAAGSGTPSALADLAGLVRPTARRPAGRMAGGLGKRSRHGGNAGRRRDKRGEGRTKLRASFPSLIRGSPLLVRHSPLLGGLSPLFVRHFPLLVRLSPLLPGDSPLFLRFRPREGRASPREGRSRPRQGNDARREGRGRPREGGSPRLTFPCPASYPPAHETCSRPRNFSRGTRQTPHFPHRR